MSLTARLLAFFLAALALVLAGFSIALFQIASSYLQRQLDDRLHSAVQILSAAAEFEIDGIEWEGDKRRIRPMDTGEETAVYWTVHGSAGELLDRAPALGDSDPLRRTLQPDDRSEGFLHKEDAGKDRRALRVVLHFDSSAVAAGKHAALYITIAISKKPVNRLLDRLQFALVATSIGTWLIALFVGRWVCRRALRPVAAMAEQARNMTADAVDERLAVPASRDELHALGISFNALLDRLHIALERQRRFTGDASHQLRTPLAALLGQVEIALRHPRSEGEYRETLERVYQQGGQLKRIVEMLLYLTRTDAEGTVADFVPFDLTFWLPEYLRSWEANSRYKDLQIILPAGACGVKAHPPLLGQLLDNLIDNAFKYSEFRTPVTLRLVAEGAQCILSVEDRGIGVNESDVSRLFDPFFRSEKVRSLGHTGVGLGLSIALRIARLFGGDISVSAVIGGGSCFTVRLPRIELQSEPELQSE